MSSPIVMSSPTNAIPQPSSESDSDELDLPKRKLEDISDSEVEEPSAKRAKCAATNSAELQKHEKFWFEDGSVYLQFEMTRLKLYKMRLALHSEWFKDLFLRKGVETEHGDKLDIRSELVLVDALEVFYLDKAGISLSDFEALLHVLEHGIDYCHAKPLFPVLASLVRAATRFRFPKILSYATTILEHTFPDKMDKVTKKPSPYAAEAVLLGKDWGLEQLLKRAFYDLARTPTFRGGSSTPGEKHAIHRLKPSDFVLLLDLQKDLSKFWSGTLILPQINCPQSQSGQACSSKTYIVHDGTRQEYHSDPIGGIEELRKTNWIEKGYCKGCQGQRLKWLKERHVLCLSDLDKWLRVDADSESDFE